MEGYGGVMHMDAKQTMLLSMIAVTRNGIIAAAAMV
jgi:hypothetical protein